MIMNPIYERERWKSAGRARFSVIAAAFNLVLAAAALVFCSAAFRKAAETGELQYAGFLDIFRWLSWIEFAMVAAVMPAGTAPMISGEREKKTLDLLLTTRMTGGTIVNGCLLSALSSAFVLMVTGLPVFASVLLFGGIRARDAALLFFCGLLTALLSGSIGIFCSACSERTPGAVTAAFAAEAVLFLVPCGLQFLLDSAAVYFRGRSVIFALSPITVFSTLLGNMTGGGKEIILSALRVSGKAAAAGMVLQILLSVSLLVAAARKISPDSGTTFGRGLLKKKE